MICFYFYIVISKKYFVCPFVCPNKKGFMANNHKPLIYLVGATGFEPATSCSQSRCATRLRHAPKLVSVSASGLV